VSVASRRAFPSRYATGCFAAALLAGCNSPSFTSSSNLVPTAGTSFAAGTYKVLHSFKGGRDGANPYAALLAVDGVLYGTTWNGGGQCSSGGCGSVFETTTLGTERVLYGFKRRPDAGGPQSPLIDLNGTLYGVAADGTFGFGAIYSVNKSGHERVLYSFKGRKDGAYPFGRLVVLDGKLYGTTSEGGAHRVGTVFSVTTSGEKRVVYSFKLGTDGAYPAAGLIVHSSILYGTTLEGGAYNFGTVFSVTASGTEHVVYSFKDGNDGAGPEGELLATGNELYGTTASGGHNQSGTVFAVSTYGKERVLHTFRNGPDDGAYPQCALIERSGTLYGTAFNGGPKSDRGVVFSLTLSGKERLLHYFGGGNDGSNPVGGLVAIDGTMYGTTEAGGTDGYGTIFAVKL
jgi:uncharacterized repeat protein (TIGR03803 family)